MAGRESAAVAAACDAAIAGVSNRLAARSNGCSLSALKLALRRRGVGPKPHTTRSVSEPIGPAPPHTPAQPLPEP